MFNGVKLRVFLLLMTGMLLSLQVIALTDPTRPSAYRAANNKQNLRLESILFSDARKVAIINGAVVAEGDSVGNVKVIKIDKESVQIKRAGKLDKLILRHTSLRQEK